MVVVVTGRGVVVVVGQVADSVVAFVVVVVALVVVALVVVAFVVVVVGACVVADPADPAQRAGYCAEQVHCEQGVPRTYMGSLSMFVYW